MVYMEDALYKYSNSFFKYIENSKKFIVEISERNLDDILTIILLKSPFILTK